MRKVTTILIITLISSLGVFSQSPGGVNQSNAAQVNGVEYQFYEGYDNTPEDGITGTIKNTGYVDDLENTDDLFLNEDNNTFSLILTAKLQIDVAGNYNFRALNTDDDVAILIDGTVEGFGNNATITTGDLMLTAGQHDIEIRYSENNGGQTINVQYDGPDSGDAFTKIASNKLFIPSPQISAWYKANTGAIFTEAGNITAWADQSGRGNDLTLTNGNPTYYATTQGELINFNPTIVFTDDQLESADHVNGLAYGKKGKTVFSVVTKTAFNGGSGWITAFGRDSSNSNSFGIETSGDDISLNSWNDKTIKLNYFTQDDFPSIISGSYQNNELLATNNSFLYANGELLVNDTQNWSAEMNNNEDLSVGVHNDNNGDGHDGRILEVIYYPWELSAVEQQRVNSYLAVKYGVTLSQTSPTDYLASDGTTKMWDATVGSGFDNDIACIGLDNGSALNQKQSRSVNNNVQVAIYIGDQSSGLPTTNTGNVDTFTVDKSFLSWGNNAGSIGYSASYTPNSFSPTGNYYIMPRVWKVQEQGTVGSVTVHAPNNADHLLVHSSSDFTAGTPTEIVLTTDGNGNKIAVLNLTNGQFFTFGNDRLPFGLCNQTPVLIHGADNNGTSGLGISAWSSNGDGTFSTSEISSSGFDRDGVGTEVFGNQNNSATYFADVNNDAYSDIVHVTESGGNAIYVYLNNGDNTFQTTNIATTGMSSVTDGVFAGDYPSEQGWIKDANNDGNLDYIFSGNDSNIHVFLGNGDGTFATTHTTSALLGVGAGGTSGISSTAIFSLDDVNNDGSIDLMGVYQNSGTGRIVVWLGNGDGTFNTNLHFSALLEDSGSSNTSGSSNNEYSQFADIDADGDLDYAHAESRDGTKQIWIFSGNGDGTFQTNAIKTDISVNPLGGAGKFANYTNAEQSFFIDVTEDGIADFVTTSDNSGASSGITVYTGNADGTFNDVAITTAISNFAVGMTSSTETTFLTCGALFAEVDTDGDGILDYADADVNGDGVVDNGVDTDGDGINDATETATGTDPNNVDSDNDGIPDGADVSSGATSIIDTDGDGIQDGADVDNTTATNNTDTDGDGIIDIVDAYHNTDPNDADGDGISDAADATPLGVGSPVVNGQDSDGDGINDAADSDDSPTDGTTDAGNIDTDGDGIDDSYDSAVLMITDVEFENIALHPNPTTNHFYIKGLETKSNIELFDMNGRKVMVINDYKDGLVNVTKLSKGMYFIKIIGNQKLITRKLIIK